MKIGPQLLKLASVRGFLPKPTNKLDLGRLLLIDLAQMTIIVSPRKISALYEKAEGSKSCR